jgi:hypothetical protein
MLDERKLPVLMWSKMLTPYERILAWPVSMLLLMSTSPGTKI